MRLILSCTTSITNYIMITSINFTSLKFDDVPKQTLTFTLTLNLSEKINYQ